MLLFGFLLMPSITFACGKSCESKTEKRCCKKETSSNKPEKKSCCSKDDNSESNDDKGCGGKCGCSSTCPSTPLNLFTDITFQNNIFNFSSIEKVKFLYTTPSISDGFYSIWLIPKIS
jgi:hypothetical protein